MNESRRVLLKVSSRLTTTGDSPYIRVNFQVPEGVSKVGARLSFFSDTLAQVPLALYDPRGLRGVLVSTYALGQIDEELWVAPNDASKGGQAGPLTAGQWQAQIFVRRLEQDADSVLEIYAELGTVPAPIILTYPENHIANSKPGWYKGELHTHSDQSTGYTTVSELIQVAVSQRYDFLAITDHFTISHWQRMSRVVNNSQIALIRAAEVPGNNGHANVHGVHQWIDPFVDGEGWGMNQVADMVHEQEGLFCVNHPMSGKLGWRYQDFDWDKADMLEVYCMPEGPNNNLSPLLWDHHLRAGRKIVGVGSSDSHDPYRKPLWAFGQIVNWIYVDGLSEKGIIEGLKRGIVYLSLGPELRFYAVNEIGQQAEMWENLSTIGGSITFQVKVKNIDKANLFVLKNGYIFDIFEVAETGKDWRLITFSDRPQQAAYYRIELHHFKKSEIYTGIAWRNYETLQAMSNPIWVEPSEI